MQVILSVNDLVWVELTTHGLSALKKFIAGKNAHIHQQCKKVLVDDYTEMGSPYYKFKVCDLMSIFGPEFNCSSPHVFTDGIIHITKPAD